MWKQAGLLLLAVQAAFGQPAAPNIQGTVLDADTQKPIPIALVLANRTGAPPFSRNTKSGADGAFQLEGLTPGDYTLCVQVPGDEYLDPCQWNGKPTTVTVAPGRAVKEISLRLTPASLVNIQVQDPQKLLSRRLADGRNPDISIGVWGPDGLYYPARRSAPANSVEGSADRYQLSVPRNTALKLHIASRDLRLGDSSGVALPAGAATQAFQQAAGDRNPKSFAFTVLGQLP